MKATAEPSTYREVFERAIAVTEERIYYSDEPVPRWVMVMMAMFSNALERNAWRRLS